VKPAYVGRRERYTPRGIGRVPCSRCGAPSHHQWQCYANDNRWLGVCERCDVDLNELALAFFRVPGRRALMKAYRASLLP
jgi:hypothetical protein